MPHTEELLMEALRRAHDIGINVVAVVCDMDTSQQKMASNLGVTEERPFFPHPSTGQPVFFIFDPPHLVKCTRNNLVNYDIEFSPNNFASWRVVRAVYQLERRSELRSATKLTSAHVNLPLGKKMSVRLAVEVFSHSVGASMMAYLDNDAYSTLPQPARVTNKEVRNTAQFLTDVGKLFDIVNSAHTGDSYGKKAITRPLLADRLEALSRARRFISGWRFMDQRPSAKAPIRQTLPFKRGWGITLAALEQLVRTQFANPEVFFMALRRFNQDCLENTFCQIRRDKGSFNDILDTTRAVANLRAVAFSTFLSSVTSKCCNSPEDGDMVLIDCFRDLPPRVVKRSSAALLPRQAEAESAGDDASECDAAGTAAFPRLPELPTEWHDNLDEAWSRIASEEVCLLDKVQYVAGYLLQKALEKRCPFMTCTQCHEALHAPESQQRAFMRRKTYDFAVRGLITPSDHLLNAVRNWESCFIKHFDRLLCGGNILRKLQGLLDDMPFLPRCHKQAVTNFVTRLFLRVRIHHACRLRTQQVRLQARRASLRKMAKLL
jgi:hypothetical protein